MEVPEEYAELDLYEVLQANKRDSQKNIRKAYLRSALRTHPDKKGGNDDEFRKVAFAYSILSNESYRKQYDETGKLDFREDATIANLFSKIFRVEITEEMIEEDRKAYQRSEEEKQDIIDSYNKYGGDFDLIFENIIHSTEQDIERIVEIIKSAIEVGTLEKTKKFSNTTTKSRISKRKSQADREAKEVEKSRKELGLESEAGLAALIRKRQAQRSSHGSIIDQLEAKYSIHKNPKKSNKRKSTKLSI